MFRAMVAWLTGVPHLGLPPHWAEVATAIATVVLALATVGLGATALVQLIGAGRERTYAVMAEFSRRWDGAEMIQSRRLLAQYGTHLKDWVEYYEAHPERVERYQLLRVPNYFEDLSVMESAGAIPFDMIQQSLGWTIVAMISAGSSPVR